MHDLDFLIHEQFESLTRREYDWVANFSGGISLTVVCLWRFLEEGRIRTTSADDGQQFGLPAPVDAAARVNARIRGAEIVSVDLRKGTLDLTVGFATGQLLQVVPDSSGYEAWQLFRQGVQFIAVGGGELAIFGASPGADDQPLLWTCPRGGSTWFYSSARLARRVAGRRTPSVILLGTTMRYPLLLSRWWSVAAVAAFSLLLGVCESFWVLRTNPPFAARVFISAAAILALFLFAVALDWAMHVYRRVRYRLITRDIDRKMRVLAARWRAG